MYKNHHKNFIESLKQISRKVENWPQWKKEGWVILDRPKRGEKMFNSDLKCNLENRHHLTLSSTDEKEMIDLHIWLETEGLELFEVWRIEKERISKNV